MSEFIVFLDENHCNNPHLLEALNEAGVPYRRHLQIFSAGLEDIEWLPKVGQQSWCLLTADKRIRSHALQRESVRTHSVRMFCFATNDVSGRETGAALRRALPRMLAIFEITDPPFTASINKAGDVTAREFD